MTRAWSGFLGGMGLQARVRRRINLALLVASALVLLASLALQESWRGTVAGLLIVQAGAIIAHLFVGRELWAQISASSDGIRITRRSRFLRFLSYREIATTLEDGPDLCVVLLTGERVRIGIADASGDPQLAVRAMRTFLEQSHARKGAG